MAADFGGQVVPMTRLAEAVLTAPPEQLVGEEDTLVLAKARAVAENLGFLQLDVQTVAVKLIASESLLGLPQMIHQNCEC